MPLPEFFTVQTMRQLQHTRPVMVSLQRRSLPRLQLRLLILAEDGSERPVLPSKLRHLGQALKAVLPPAILQQHLQQQLLPAGWPQAWHQHQLHMICHLNHPQSMVSALLPSLASQQGQPAFVLVRLRLLQWSGMPAVRPRLCRKPQALHCLWPKVDWCNSRSRETLSASKYIAPLRRLPPRQSSHGKAHKVIAWYYIAEVSSKSC